MHHWSHSEELVPVYLTLSESRTGPAGRCLPRGCGCCLPANQTLGTLPRACEGFATGLGELFSPKEGGERLWLGQKGEWCHCALQSQPDALGRCCWRVMLLRLWGQWSVVEEKTTPSHARGETAACSGQGMALETAARLESSSSVRSAGWGWCGCAAGHLWSSCLAEAAPAGWLCLLRRSQHVGNTSAGGKAGGS